MSPAEYLEKYPKARPSTIAFLMKRAEKAAELRREIRESRQPYVTRIFRSIADAFRSWRG